MKNHLYEFVSSTRKLKCQCGWERTLKSTNPDLAYAAFEEHRSKPMPLN